MALFNSSSPYPEGVISFLDTDLYKLTMQSAVLDYFPDVPVTYAFTNRTPHMKFSREAFSWLQEQVNRLGHISLSPDEHEFLSHNCSYLGARYLDFLRGFRLAPRQDVTMRFVPHENSDSNLGDVEIEIAGTWLATILYEIPLLALISEAYFKFVDTDWDYAGQEEQARDKGLALLRGGCVFSEFGTRRRRDYHTQALVCRGLLQARKHADTQATGGKLVGTSNLHLAMRFGMEPVGTIAHEWFMGVAAITGDYGNATERALQYWTAKFGAQLGIVLTDTFGTGEFLRVFNKPITSPPTPAAADTLDKSGPFSNKTYAQLFSGVRQDSGDPASFVATMRQFYTANGIEGTKTIVFSDSLDVQNCLEYKALAEAEGFRATFGVGTHLTNDFCRLKTGEKSLPLNIVIKLSSAAGRKAVKLSDNIGKNTGDADTIDQVKQALGYTEAAWAGGDESSRWGNSQN